MCKFITGIDDFGTMIGISQGWAFVSFEQSYYAEFKEEAQKILDDSKLKSFHGKDFKRKKNEHYKKFLELIRETLQKGQSSVACATLLDESWKSEFRGFVDRVLKDSFETAGIQDEKLILGSQFLAKPLFTYLRISSTAISASSTTVHIDYHMLAEGFSEIDLLVKNQKISPQLPVVTAVNAYRSKQYTSAPLIDRESIEILDDEKSFMIQAADILGNFSAALVFKVLGKSSSTNDLKAKIMSDVFSDLIDTSVIPNMVEIVGEDFRLKESGSFSFTIK